MFDPTSHFRVPMDNRKLDGYIAPFVERDEFCRNDCANCGYCENFAKKCLDTEMAAEVTGLAREFIREFDEYRKMIASEPGVAEPEVFPADLANASFGFEM